MSMTKIVVPAPGTPSESHCRLRQTSSYAVNAAVGCPDRKLCLRGACLKLSRELVSLWVLTIGIVVNKAFVDRIGVVNIEWRTKQGQVVIRGGVSDHDAGIRDVAREK